MRADVVGLWGAASHNELRMTTVLRGCARLSGRLKGAASHNGLLRKHIREMLRLRRLAGARTLPVCREVVTTQTGLSMTTLLGGCARLSGRLKGAAGAGGYSG